MGPESQFRPESEAPNDADAIDAFLRRAPAMLVSVIIHLIVLICLAIFTYRIQKQEPLIIEIGQLADQQQPQIESIVIEPMDVDVQPEIEDVVSVPIAVEPIKIQGTAVTPAPQTTHFVSGRIKGLSPSFSSRIQDARKNGIDIVVVFDSTGSMRGEIETVKRRIHAIGNAVLDKIPRAKFSLATYRDVSDDYLVRGIRLSDEIRQVHSFVSGVSAGGGGDMPEAVQAGMLWAMQANSYRQQSQKVMLIFGDAPPHQSDMELCLQLAEEFRDYGKGSVHTVTCRRKTPLPEFYSIARAGGGEAYVMMNVDQLMEDLLVIAFGGQDREEVLRFFEVQPQPSDNRRSIGPSRRRR